MKLATMFMLFVVLSSVVLVSGCATTSNNPVKDQKDVSEAVEDITVDVGNLGDTLNEIDSDLG